MSSKLTLTHSSARKSCMYGKCKEPVTYHVVNSQEVVVAGLCDKHRTSTWLSTSHGLLETRSLTEETGDNDGYQETREENHSPRQQCLDSITPGSSLNIGLEKGRYSDSDSLGGEDSIGKSPSGEAFREKSGYLPASSSRVPTPSDLSGKGEMDLKELANLLYASGNFSDIRSGAQAIVKILAGRELGFGAIASLTGIHIIQGKPAYSANLIAAAIQRSGRFEFRVTHLTTVGCEIAFMDRGREIGRSAFSMEDARVAGLPTGKNVHSWRNYPRNMLFARALTNGARWYCPAVFGGIAPYTAEELGEPDYDRDEYLEQEAFSEEGETALRGPTPGDD